MFDELLKKELLKKGILERKSKDNMDIDTNDYKIKKLDEPMRVVVLFETLKKIYPESKDNIEMVKEGYIFKSSEIHYKGDNLLKDSELEIYYKDSKGGFIYAGCVVEVIQSKDFGIARDNITLKRFFNQASRELADIDKDELFVIRYKFKIADQIFYNIVYKGKAGYIVEPNIEEIDNLTIEDSYRIIKELAMSI